MSDRLPYPRDPDGSANGTTVVVRDLLTLVRQLFFPKRGTALHIRVAELEARVRKLEEAP